MELKLLAKAMGFRYISVIVYLISLGFVFAEYYVFSGLLMLMAVGLGITSFIYDIRFILKVLNK